MNFLTYIIKISILHKITYVTFFIRALSILGQVTNIPTDLYMGISAHPEEEEEPEVKGIAV